MNDIIEEFLGKESSSIVEQDGGGKVDRRAFKGRPTTVGCKEMSQAEYIEQRNRDIAPVAVAAGETDVQPFFVEVPTAPVRYLAKESATHRVILNMLARGFKDKEVAETLGVTQPTITNLKRQPWAQKYLAEMIAKIGKDEITELLRSEALPALHRIIDISKGAIEGVRVSDQLKANESIVERWLGPARTSLKPPPAEDVDLNELSDEELFHRAQKRFDGN